MTRAAATTFAALLLAAACAHAERADRDKPLTIEADRPGVVDIGRKTVVFEGKVVIAQGTLRIRAERVELLEGEQGYRQASATGSAAAPATFSQKREGVDETFVGAAERIEYEDRGDVVRFTGAASVRRLRGGVVADEISGHQIVYDNRAERFSVIGQDGGRVRAVLAPREKSAPAEARR